MPKASSFVFFIVLLHTFSTLAIIGIVVFAFKCLILSMSLTLYAASTYIDFGTLLNNEKPLNLAV